MWVGNPNQKHTSKWKTLIKSKIVPIFRIPMKPWACKVNNCRVDILVEFYRYRYYRYGSVITDISADISPYIKYSIFYRSWYISFANIAHIGRYFVSANTDMPTLNNYPNECDDYSNKQTNSLQISGSVYWTWKRYRFAEWSVPDNDKCTQTQIPGTDDCLHRIWRRAHTNPRQIIIVALPGSSI